MANNEREIITLMFQRTNHLSTRKPVGSSEVIDYLTCGSCLREFPLQKITTFIQHKKLDCGDDNGGSEDNPELQCNYCPKGFMTAWALLLHAQLTHNLKIFLAKASKSILEHARISQLLPEAQTLPSVSLQYGLNQTSVTPVSGVGDYQTSLVLPKSQISARNSLENSLDTGENISFTTLSLMGSRNILVNSSGYNGSLMSLSNTGVKTGVELAEVSNASNTLSGKKLNSVQIHQRIIAVPCKQAEITPAVQKSSRVLLDSQCATAPAFRSRSQTLPSIHLPRVAKDDDASPTTVSSQVLEVQTDDITKLPHDSGDAQDNIQSNNVLREISSGDSMEIKSSSFEAVRQEEVYGSSFDVCHDKYDKSFDDAKTMGILEPNVDHSDMCYEKSKPTDSANVHHGAVENQEGVKDPGQEDDFDLETDSIKPCCSRQGCGITVIPGSHQTLQKCCNAVVPKKRKRHFETKHMPFSWSSSKYAKRHTLQGSKERRHSSSGNSNTGYNLTTGSTIYIDFEPGSFVSDYVNSSSSAESTAHETQSQSSIPNVLSNERVVTSQNKPRSLILRPGAVFSIPLTYTIPSSSAPPVVIPAVIQQQKVAVSSLASSKSHDTQSDTSLSAVETKVEGNISQSVAKTDTDDSKVIAEDEIKQVVVEEPLRKKYPTSKPFHCEVCDVAFNQRIHLKKHMSKHTGIKPYKCGQCDYSTVERSHLKVHIRIHTGEKPFKCTYCEYATAQNSTLKIHLKRHHGGRMFQCPNCDKNFTQKTQLTHHEWEHSPPDKPVKQQDHIPVMKLEDVGDSQQLKSSSSLTSEQHLQINPVTEHSYVVSEANNNIVNNGVIGQTDNFVSADCVTSLANSSADSSHVISTANDNEDLGHVISVPSDSMTDTEAAELLNSLTAKLLEAADQQSQSHKDAT